MTVFRELRDGLTEDGRLAEVPSATLSTAEAISVLVNGLSLECSLRFRGARRRGHPRPGSSAAW
ncbi:MAG: hypothetical protein R2715_17740 [Ilumatobacteraceae bacterium]